MSKGESHQQFSLIPNCIGVRRKLAAILFVLFWISLRLRDGGWSVAGLKRPASWVKTAEMAVAATSVIAAGQ